MPVTRRKFDKDFRAYAVALAEHKPAMTWWAVLGLNQWPLPCQGDPPTAWGSP
jgi:hypothetical protein